MERGNGKMDYEVYDEIGKHRKTIEGVKGIINLTCLDIEDEFLDNLPNDNAGDYKVSDWAKWANSLPPDAEFCGLTRCPSGKFEIYEEEDPASDPCFEFDEESLSEDSNGEDGGCYWEHVIGVVPETKQTTSFYEGTVWLFDGWLIVWLP